jgi:hypothetical protein
MHTPLFIVKRMLLVVLFSVVITLLAHGYFEMHSMPLGPNEDRTVFWLAVIVLTIIALLKRRPMR